jgi:predicted secreted acid phosphatase
MPIKISNTKGFDNKTFDTYVPELTDSADIQNALELFYYGNSENGT